MKLSIKKLTCIGINILLVFSLISCSRTMGKDEAKKPDDSYLSDNKTEAIAPTETVNGISNSLLKATTGDIIGAGNLSSSYAIELTPDSLYKSADYVLIVKAEAVEDVRFLSDTAPFPLTFIKLQVLENLKGNRLEPVISAGFSGGTISLSEYIERFGLKDVEKEAIINLSADERNEKKVSMYPIELVDIKENGEYLLFLAYDDKHKCMYQIADGYSVYSSDGNGGYYNPLQKSTVSLEDLKKME